MPGTVPQSVVVWRGPATNHRPGDDRGTSAHPRPPHPSSRVALAPVDRRANPAAPHPNGELLRAPPARSVLNKSKDGGNVYKLVSLQSDHACHRICQPNHVLATVET